jgi:hypothetical protein
VSGLQVVRFVRHLVRPPSVVVVHLRRLRARVLLSSDCVRGVAASGVLARVRRAWLVVDGVGELVLDRGGGSSVARSPPVDGRGGEPQVPQAASFPSVVSDREYIVVDVLPCTPARLRSPRACICGCCAGVGTGHRASPRWPPGAEYIYIFICYTAVSDCSNQKRTACPRHAQQTAGRVTTCLTVTC